MTTRGLRDGLDEGTTRAASKNSDDVSTHGEALEETLASVHLGPQHAALAELCRTLAAQMDAAGDEPSTRLTAAYLSALKDVARVKAKGAVEKKGKLAQLRAQASVVKA